jgi:CBS domain containing-hemolysin-like protein
MGQEHSRYPVLDEDDGIVGVVHLHDVLASTAPDSTPIADLTRDALILPEMQSLPDAMRELRATRNQLACVIDEYGGLTGVITIEDLAEELVGEITDEHDDGVLDPSPVSADDGSWTMAGEVHVDEVERAIGVDLPDGDYETIAGFAIAHHGSLPDIGTRIEVDLPPDNADLANDDESPIRFVTIEVQEIDSHVPSLLTLTIDERTTEHDENSAESDTAGAHR